MALFAMEIPSDPAAHHNRGYFVCPAFLPLSSAFLCPAFLHFSSFFSAGAAQRDAEIRSQPLCLGIEPYGS
jgi:hypothetical protein